MEIIIRSLKRLKDKTKNSINNTWNLTVSLTTVLDSPGNSETLKLSSDACGMAGWDEVLQGKHLSPPIP